MAEAAALPISLRLGELRRYNFRTKRRGRNMPLSMYQITVPVLQRGLGVLSTYMDLAEQAAETRKFDPANLVGARLAPDMLPLSGQVQRASDTAKAAMGRLGGIAVP